MRREDELLLLTAHFRQPNAHWAAETEGSKAWHWASVAKNTPMMGTWTEDSTAAGETHCWSGGGGDGGGGGSGGRGGGKGDGGGAATAQVAVLPVAISPSVSVTTPVSITEEPLAKPAQVLA